MAGRYSTGERLIEADVATLFSVSRGPVRDAFLLLERRRFITIEPRRGAYVRPITLTSITEIFNVRSALFATAARTMAKVRTESSLRELSRNVQTVKALADDAETMTLQFLNAVNEMGKIIVAGSGNELIADLLRDLEQHTVWASLWELPPHFQAPLGRKRKAQFMANIVEAIQCGDANGAATAMQCSTDFSRDQIIDALQRRQDGEAAPWLLQ